MMIDDATLQNALDACPTPLYLFDQQVLNDRITRLRASLPSRIKLCYAMKANPFIVREASALADCVEACSPGEVLICANAGVPFEKIVLSGGGRTVAAWTICSKRIASPIDSPSSLPNS